MSSRKKLTLSLTVVALVIISAVVAVVGVLAATQQTVQSVISIKFTATDIDGSVSVRYGVKATSATALDSGTTGGSFTFTAGGSSTGDVNVNPTEAIEGRSQALYIEYTFNRATVNYGVAVVFTGSQDSRDAFVAEYYTGSAWAPIVEAASATGVTGTKVLTSIGTTPTAATGSSVLLTRIRIDENKSSKNITVNDIAFAFDINKDLAA